MAWNGGRVIYDYIPSLSPFRFCGVSFYYIVLLSVMKSTCNL